MMQPLDPDACLDKLSQQDLVALLSGANMWHTHKVEQLGVPPMRVSDGPNGIRGIRFFDGFPANCFPCATGLAASFDEELLHEVGQQYGMECRAKGVHLWLGPTLNMQRTPLGGRGFESFSEDPLLSGRMSAAIIRGVQSQGVAAFPKHFVCNDQETDRHMNSSEVSWRALREIYLKPFQICIKEADPWGLMTSYNRVNGIHVPEHPILMNQILRGEWGFDGTVMSDWYGTYSTVEGVKATVDLEMPGASLWRGKALARALNSRKIELATVKACARRMLVSASRAIASGIEFDKEEEGIDTPETRALLLKTAQEAIVLIKHSNGMLPIEPARVRKLAVIGPNCKVACISGGGSASLKPYYAISPLDGIKEVAQQQNIEVVYAPGIHTSRYLPLLDPLVTSPDGVKGRISLAYYAQDPSVEGVQAVHEKSVDSSYAFMLDNIPFDVVPRHCWMHLNTIFTPDESGEWEFGLAIGGQAELFVDGKLLVSNTTNQRPGELFFGSGTQEEKANVRLEQGKDYAIRMEWSNFRPVDPSVAFVTFGGFRIGARKIDTPKAMLEQALRVAESCDAVVLVTGLSADYEGEGFDRKDMKQPEGVDKLIEKITKVNSQTCVVVQSGTQTEMPWASSVPAIIQAFYGGNETGRAIANVLFGIHNPSGKMPLSFPKILADFPSHPFAPGKKGFSYYTDDILMGYRGMLAKNIEPLACFGHGLSYTTFEISGVEIGSPVIEKDHRTIGLEIQVDVQNTGERAGQEVVQVYIAPPPDGALPRAPMELASFGKVRLQPGEKKALTLKLDRLAFCYWEPSVTFQSGNAEGAWRLDAGIYTVHIGTSLDRIISHTEVVVSDGISWNGL